MAEQRPQRYQAHRSYDQIVKGDIVIKKVPCKKYDYLIKFSKASKFFIYQTWSSENAEKNKLRYATYIRPKNWVKLFDNEESAIKFTPTAVMEIGNKKYIFVINNAVYNDDKKYKLVFHVSVEDIVKDNTTKPLICLPIKKKYKGVRFDIDDAEWCGFMPCPPPNPNPAPPCSNPPPWCGGLPCC